MAAGSIPKPGSVDWAPCATECKHSDCAANRALVETECKECGKPIGYDAPFYQVGDPDTTSHHRALVHADCYERAVRETQRVEERKATRPRRRRSS